MSTTVRPDNLKAALDAKVAASMAQLAELREAEQPRPTPHLNAREIIGTFLRYARGVYSVAGTFGKANAGDLQFNAWYEQWVKGLGDTDRALWKELERVQPEPGHGAELIEVETSVAAHQRSPGAGADVRKSLVRFAVHAQRAASDVCYDYVRLTRRFANDFVREHARFLR